MSDVLIISYPRLPDDAIYDEVRITTIPRFKTSDMSGDEWRTSVHIQFFRKGELLAELSRGSLDYAISTLRAIEGEARDNGTAGYSKTKCMQPGCSEEATVTFRLKHRYYQGHIVDDEGFEYRRKFCERHAYRGDADFEDGDENYELIEGGAPDRANIPDEDISIAQRMEIDMRHIDTNDKEALAKALQEALKKARGK